MITDEIISYIQDISKKRDLGKTLEDSDLLVLLLESLLREDGYGKSKE